VFERFTEAARLAVMQAQQAAVELGARKIDAEHVLLGVLADEATLPSRVLRELGVDRGSVVAALRDRGAVEAQALRSIGVDLDAVRSRVEAAFGPGALERRRARRSWLPFRRSVAAGPRTGRHVPFSAPAKRALEQSLRQALELKHRYIGSEHLLLGLIATDHDPAAMLLRQLGVEPADIRGRVHEELRSAA